jgi:hypothetical protein
MSEEIYDVDGLDWPSIEEDARTRVEPKITGMLDHPETVTTEVKKAPRTKAKGKDRAKDKGKSKGDLTPLLNMLAIEIQEAMDRLDCAQKTEASLVKANHDYLTLQYVCDDMQKEIDSLKEKI